MKRLLLLAFLLAAPSWGQIAFDDTDELLCGSGGSCNTGATFSWTHSPVGTPGAMIVLIQHFGVSTDVLGTCTYGGVAMAEVGQAFDTATEAGACYAFFLGASIPTGNQTVQCADSGSSGTKHAVSISLTAGADTELAGTGFCEVNENADDPSCSITGIAGASFAALGIFSGRGDVTLTDSGTGFTDGDEADNGSTHSDTAYQDAEQASGDQTLTWTTDMSDDVAMCGIAIQEVAAAPAGRPRRRPIIFQ